MKHSYCGAALALAALVAQSMITLPAYAGDQDFTLVNQTGYQIDEVHVSPHSSSQWGPDIMGRNTLDNQTSVDITFRPNNQACNYDLQVIYHDGDKSEWGNLNLCEISKVTLYWNRSSGQTRAVTE